MNELGDFVKVHGLLWQFPMSSLSRNMEDFTDYFSKTKEKARPSLHYNKKGKIAEI